MYLPREVCQSKEKTAQQRTRGILGKDSLPQNEDSCEGDKAGEQKREDSISRKTMNLTTSIITVK